MLEQLLQQGLKSSSIHHTTPEIRNHVIDIVYISLVLSPFCYFSLHIHPRTSISLLHINFLNPLPSFLPVITQSLLELQANSFILSTISPSSKEQPSFFYKRIQENHARCSRLRSPSLPVSLPLSPPMISLSQNAYTHPPQRSTSLSPTSTDQCRL